MKTHYIAISGLKSSGKTVLLATLLNYLRSKGRLQARRIPGVGDCHLDLGGMRPRSFVRAPNDDDGQIREFQVNDTIQTLRRGDWPRETDVMQTFCGDLEYCREKDGQPRTVRICFFDYPGEYLGDLPMVDLSFQEWSVHTLERLQDPNLPYCRYFTTFLAAERESSADFKTLVRLYRDAVLAAYADWYYFLSPIIGLRESEGRYCGEKDAEFFPTVNGGTDVIRKASANYQSYGTGLLKRFWERLQRCRQHMFLIDIFSVLQWDKKMNVDHLKDQQSLLDEVFKTIARRPTKVTIWKPQTYHRALRRAIRRIHFVASKADLFPEDGSSPQSARHRSRLLDYLEQYLDDNLAMLRVSLEKVTLNVMSAIVCTQTMQCENDGDTYLLPNDEPEKKLPYRYAKTGLPEHLEDFLQEKYGPFEIGPPSPTGLGLFPHWGMSSVTAQLFDGIL